MAPEPDVNASLMHAIVEHALDPSVIIDASGRITHVLGDIGRVLRLQPAEALGQFFIDLVHPEDAHRLSLVLNSSPGTRTESVACRVRSHDSWLDLGVSITNLAAHPSVQGRVVTMRDASRQRLADETIVHTALHDPLTGLPNRALLTDRLSHALARCQRSFGEHTAVLFLDLDNFKVINDSLGHLVGDLLLTELAHRLVSTVRLGDTVARFGGDEFAVLLDSVSDVDQATATAERLMEALREPVELESRMVMPDVSIGIALSDGRGEAPDDLLRKADLAMYHAKTTGKGRCAVFDLAMQARADARLQVETGLRDAIANGELRVHFQPIVSLDTGRVTGLEALVRWQREGYGLVSPADFVPVAEETGLIIPLGQWVLQESCRRLRDWQVRYPAASGLRVSVNLAPRQLRHRTLVDDVALAIRTAGLDASSVTLEITETALIENVDEITLVLHQLKALGVHLAIDDFGTGYSSLSYLRRLPVDEIKIDRSFVNRLGHSDRDLGIVRGILDIAGTLELTTIAEGIETDTQLATVRSLGGGSGQGFLFARPLRPEDVDALLTSYFDLPFSEAAA
jgi:diguanylate cyclase (GGDEF)-like protein